MLQATLVELLGSFVFITVIFRFASQSWGAFPIGLALCAAILFGGAVSGGHFNPAVSVAMFVANKTSLPSLCLYIVAQLVGGYCAWSFVSQKLLP